MELDAALVRRSLCDGPEPFAELVSRHERAIYRYLCRRVGAVAAEDLLSEVWVAAFADRANFDPAWSSARPWLFGIARNRVRQHWRRRRAGASMVEDRIDPWPDIDGRLVASAHLEDLKAALRSLPPDDREVLLLVAWEELSPSEAAAVLGIPAGTARSRLRRARLLVQARLAATPTQVTAGCRDRELM